MPGRITISAPISAPPTPIGRWRLSRSPRNSAAPRLIRIGLMSASAVASAKPMKLRLAKKNAVAPSCVRERARSHQGQRVFRAGPVRRPRYRRTKARWPTKRAQITSTVGQWATRPLATASIAVKAKRARAMNTMPLRVAWAGTAAGLGKVASGPNSRRRYCGEFRATRPVGEFGFAGYAEFFCEKK